MLPAVPPDRRPIAAAVLGSDLFAKVVDAAAAANPPLRLKILARSCSNVDTVAGNLAAFGVCGREGVGARALARGEQDDAEDVDGDDECSARERHFLLIRCKGARLCGELSSNSLFLP